MNRARNLEVRRNAGRWYDNPEMWGAWAISMYWRSVKVRILFYVTMLLARFRLWTSHNDDGFNSNSMAVAFNLCFIVCGVILLLAFAIF